ncbi:hypothetical protein CHUAL_001700 [Chamberlinius hualienensis]
MTSDERYNFSDISKLTISMVNNEDEGEYKCQISAPNNTVVLRNVVRIKVPSKIHPYPTEGIEVNEGEVVQLRCPAEGQPPPKIVWESEGVPLRKTSTGVLKDNNEVLEFASINGTDSGQYECIADNGAGKDNKVFTIKVKYTPIVTIKKEHFSSGNGVNMDLVCSVKADPPAKIHWYKDNKDIVVNERIHLKEKGNHYFTLKITNAQPEDFGKYRCEAKNKFGLAKAEVDVSGTIRDEAAPQVSTTTAPEPAKELISKPNGTNGSPPLEQRAKVVAVMTVIILIAFF